MMLVIMIIIQTHQLLPLVMEHTLQELQVQKQIILLEFLLLGLVLALWLLKPLETMPDLIQ